MDRRYYDEYYMLERNHWFFTARLNILRSVIQKRIFKSANSNVRILNIGVATGATSQMLDSFGDVVSLEYDKECCEILEEKTGIRAINGSILDLPFSNNSFDLICCFDVIEHVEDDLLAVKELTRVVKENGFVFITVPAFMFLWSHHDVVNHHFRRYNRGNLLRLFKDQPLEIRMISYFNFFLFFPIAFFRLTLSKIISKEKKETTGSDFEIMGGSKAVNTLFYSIFNLEKHLLNLGITFSVGVSLMALLKKNSLRK